MSMMMQATDGPNGDDAYDAWPHNGVCVAGFEASFQSAIIAPMQVVDNGTGTHGGNSTESPASGGAMPMFSAKVSVNMVLIAISLIGLWLWLWLWRRFVPPIAGTWNRHCVALAVAIPNKKNAMKEAADTTKTSSPKPSDVRREMSRLPAETRSPPRSSVPIHSQGQQTKTAAPCKIFPRIPSSRCEAEAVQARQEMSRKLADCYRASDIKRYRGHCPDVPDHILEEAMQLGKQARQMKSCALTEEIKDRAQDQAVMACVSAWRSKQAHARELASIGERSTRH
jgi:hypothetical protein